MSSYQTDAPPPGLFIKEELEARGLAQRDLAYILGTSEQVVTRILTGKYGISPEMAKALGQAFDVNPELFINLQKAYELSRAPEPDPGVARRARLQNVYPIREMINRGWLEDTDATMLEAQMTRFFKTNDIPYMSHAAKKTHANDEVTPAQWAWLYRVRQIAEAMPSTRYSERALRGGLQRLRALMTAPEEARNVPRFLIEAGVRCVVVEGLPNAKIDGVCTWLDKSSPVIGLSTRFDRIDNFWFVLRHEIEHVLEKHGQDDPVIDAELEGERAADSDSVSAQERLANVAAADFCVPRNEMKSFILRKDPFFSERDVIGFARRMHVHPGIVVGQIQAHTKRWDLLRKHLVKIRQYVLPGAMVDGWGQVSPVTI